MKTLDFSEVRILNGALFLVNTQPAGNYMFKVNNKDTRTMSILVSLLLTLNIFQTLSYCFYG